MRGGDISNGTINEGNLRTITPEVSRFYARTLLRGGELIVSLVGNPGEVSGVPDSLVGANLARQVGLIALRPEISSHYVKYYLMSPLGRAELFLRTQGAVQQVINLSDLKRVKVRLRDRSSQERIANILSTYDDLIENNRRRIALLEQAVSELYREWFDRLRFPGYQSTRRVDGLPEGWERKPLNSVAVVNAQSYRSKDLPEALNYIDISSVSSGRILDKQSMVAAEAPGRARRKAAHGDVIWSNVRPNLKAYSLILDPEENDVFSTGFSILSATGVPFTFLYQSVTSERFVKYLVNQTTGASYPAVRPIDFERAIIVTPPRRLLAEFSRISTRYYHLIAKLSKENEQLKAARDLLLPRLMSGGVAV